MNKTAAQKRRLCCCWEKESARSVRRTRRSDRSVERTGGEARCLDYQSLDRETPLGSGESTRTTRNCVNFRNSSQTGCRQVTRSRNCRIDAISIGCDQLTRPYCGAACEGYRELIGE
jgi:hypothetical protein